MTVAAVVLMAMTMDSGWSLSCSSVRRRAQMTQDEVKVVGIIPHNG